LSNDTAYLLIKEVKVLLDQLNKLGSQEYLCIGFWYNLKYFSKHVLEGLISLRAL